MGKVGAQVAWGVTRLSSQFSPRHTISDLKFEIPPSVAVGFGANDLIAQLSPHAPRLTPHGHLSRALSPYILYAPSDPKIRLIFSARTVLQPIGRAQPIVYHCLVPISCVKNYFLKTFLGVCDNTVFRARNPVWGRGEKWKSQRAQGTQSNFFVTLVVFVVKLTR